MLANFFKDPSACLNKMMPTWNGKYFPKLFLGFDCNLGRGCPWAGSKRPRCPSPRSFRSGIAGCRSPRPACPVWHKDMINQVNYHHLSISSPGLSRYITLHQGHHFLPCQNFGGQKVICINNRSKDGTVFSIKSQSVYIKNTYWSKMIRECNRSSALMTHTQQSSRFTNNNSATLFLSLFPRNRTLLFPLLKNAAMWEHFFALPGEVLADHRGVEHVDSHQEVLEVDLLRSRDAALSLSGWMSVVWVLLERGGGCLPCVGGLVSKQLRERGAGQS